MFFRSEARQGQELGKLTAGLARDAVGEKSALWLCWNLGQTLWPALRCVCFPPTGSSVSREFLGVPP